MAHVQVTQAVDAAVRAFRELTSSRPSNVAFAPGRVNLIGEHTDYNDGFVLPMAIEEGVAAAFRTRSDGILRVYTSDLRQTREMRLAAISRANGALAGWFRYAAGVAWAMQAAGLPLEGADIAVAATLPAGAGLSSSAALELAVARALTAAAGLSWDARAAAMMAQRAEHEFAGVACGIMDQMAVACAREGTALLLDCRSLETEHIALPASVRVMVMNSGIRRSLADSAYNDRRASCERAVAVVRTLRPGVRALRDVDDALLEQARPLLDDLTFRRASHVVAENRRPHAFARALAAGDLETAGWLMEESHRSLRDLYEVSCHELDVLVSAASAQHGCYGARLTGAGFGGCAIALVESDSVDSFASNVAAAYASATGLPASIFVSRAAAGARLID